MIVSVFLSRTTCVREKESERKKQRERKKERQRCIQVTLDCVHFIFIWPHIMSYCPRCRITIPHIISVLRSQDEKRSFMQTANRALIADFCFAGNSLWHSARHNHKSSPIVSQYQLISIRKDEAWTSKHWGINLDLLTIEGRGGCSYITSTAALSSEIIYLTCTLQSSLLKICVVSLT